MIPSNTPTDRRADRKMVFVILFTLYLLLILFPILRADRYHNDDLARALYGVYAWKPNGRPLTTFVMELLEFNLKDLVDISPLPQLAAIAILAWTGTLIARRYAIGSPWLGALVAFPLGAQPFYLENLSFKFDALSMSLALLCALLPCLAIRSGFRGWWLGSLSLFACLNLYQPAINAFLIFALLETVVAQIQRQPPAALLKRLTWRAAQFLLAVGVYHWTVMPSLDEWVKQHSETVHGINDIGIVKANVVQFYSYIAGAFNQRWLNAFVPLLLLAGALMVLVGLRYALLERRQRPTWVFLLLLPASILLPLAAITCITGPLLLLTHPVAPPRVLIGVGALLSAVLVIIACALRQWRVSDYWSLGYATVWALGMASFAGAYGNALSEQKGYEDRIASRLADDLAELGAESTIRSVLIDGSVGYAPATAHVAEQFPIIHSLIVPYLSQDSSHTRPFLAYYLPGTPELGNDPSAQAGIAPLLAQACAIPAIRTRSAYALRVVGETAIATFPSGRPTTCESLPD